MLSLWDTRKRKKLPFLPLMDTAVRFYSCGPTVYNRVHIGNLRSFVFADTLRRWLQYGEKYSVQWVMNITDVDDKTIRDSKKTFPEKDPMEALLLFTRQYEDLFFKDIEKLNIPKAEFFKNPRATESISQMQELVRNIAQNGFAYEQDGAVYFDVQKYAQKHQYGQLVEIDFSQQKSTERVENDEYEKECAADFVLWKEQKQGEPAWDFDFFGKNLRGRPGWHLECSAMEKEAFGLPFDIHSGGVDLCFPHHEDEIAQSVAGYGVDPNTYWVHNEHLMVNGQKMSKSLGNFFTLEDLEEKGFAPEIIRFFLATNHYRSKLNLTEEALVSSKTAIVRLRNAVWEILQKEVCTEDLKGDVWQDFSEKFTRAMQDDLNVSVAISLWFDFVFFFLGAQFSQDDRQKFLNTVVLVENVFGVRLSPQQESVPEEIHILAQKRDLARKEKKWEEADQYRQQIEEKGFVLRDKEGGYDLLQKEL
jgi:cysteinyl-tRNA synthetase